MNDNTTQHKRCATVVSMRRSDELTLGDLILVTHWDGKVTISTVTGLVLLNDSVDVSTSDGDEMGCKVGTMWHVVEVAQ